MSVASAPRIIVDGANVIHAWPDLRRLLPRQRGTARERLLQRLQILHDLGPATVVVVFDGRGDRSAVEAIPGQPPMLVVYTEAGQTADDVIERMVARSPKPADCTVATADRLERQTVEAAGARAISPEELAAWIERADLQTRIRIAARRRSPEGSPPT